MKTLQNFLTLLLILLFTYGAVTKILDLDNFQMQLQDSFGLHNFGKVAAVAVITACILAVALLSYSATLLFGLGLVFALATLFSLEISWILLSGESLPCTCIGWWDHISWNGNLAVNIGIMMTAAVAMMMAWRQKKI